MFHVKHWSAAIAGWPRRPRRNVPRETTSAAIACGAPRRLFHSTRGSMRDLDDLLTAELHPLRAEDPHRKLPALAGSSRAGMGVGGMPVLSAGSGEDSGAGKRADSGGVFHVKRCLPPSPAETRAPCSTWNSAWGATRVLADLPAAELGQLSTHEAGRALPELAGSSRTRLGVDGTQAVCSASKGYLGLASGGDSGGLFHVEQRPVPSLPEPPRPLFHVEQSRSAHARP